MLKKGVTVVIILFINMSFLIITIPETAEAISTPYVEIRWAKGQEVQSVDVHPGASGLVSFCGTVSADLVSGSPDVKVNLSASTDRGWPVIITPEVMILWGGIEEKPFSATVKVTHEALQNEIGSITLGGEVILYPGNVRYGIRPITGSIKINQYYQYYMTSYQPSKQVTAGNKLGLNISINNIGNGVDIFELDLDNSDQLNKNDIKVRFLENFEVQPKKSALTDIVLKTSYQTKPGKYEIKFTLGSIYNETGKNILEQTNFTFTIFIKDNYQYPLTISFFIVGIIIISVLIFKKIQVRKKSIKKFSRRRIQPPKSNPPLSIQPNDDDPFKW